MGVGTTRVFTVQRDIGLVINNVVIQDAKSTADGAAIANLGTVFLTNSTIRNNALGKFGHESCDPCQGGGISNDGTMLLTNVTLKNNSADGGTGGGIFNLQIPSNLGGGIYNDGILIVSESKITDNVAGNGGAGIYNKGTLIVDGSTVATNNGGGLTNAGQLLVTASTIAGNIRGGVFNGANLSITNSTISGNKSVGIADSPCNAHTTLTNVTVANNETGLYNYVGPSNELTCTIADSWMQVNNSIVADNTAANCTGRISSGDFNLEKATTCRFNQQHDLSNADPKLGPLAANGGPTQTHALPVGSPAVDAGGGYGNGCPRTDQRGVARPQGPACDIGAFELQQ